MICIIIKDHLVPEDLATQKMIIANILLENQLSVILLKKYGK